MLANINLKLIESKTVLMVTLMEKKYGKQTSKKMKKYTNIKLCKTQECLQIHLLLKKIMFYTN